MSRTLNELDDRMAMAHDWAHDNLAEEAYKNLKTLNIAIRAYMAGYDRGIDG